MKIHEACFLQIVCTCERISYGKIDWRLYVLLNAKSTLHGAHKTTCYQCELQEAR